ncbi:hypothetical protein Oscil6304_5800 [Oscillatoria acuminata PCC 6304]|uniref:Uncharacterized protein n=2 Tax=Oscillatoria acuminata TaxID=118323 RepID=K9TRX3_9CYAN|nr:hypothetical protein Oscil6304_5800 [Oscillatoria acuminata PCC 6304]
MLKSNSPLHLFPEIVIMSVIVMLVVSYVAWLLTSLLVSIPIFFLGSVRLPLQVGLFVIFLLILWTVED